MSRSTPGVLVAVLLVAASAVGCRTAGDVAGRDGDAGGVSWPATGAGSASTAGAEGLAWEAEGRVHLADGSVLDVGEPIGPWVVAGDGIVTMGVGEGAAGGAGYVHDTGEATYVDADGTVTGLGVDVVALAASQDGRYLGLVDASSGPMVMPDTRLLEVVVVDLEDGSEVVRTARGMGERGDDLAAIYPELDLDLAFAPAEDPAAPPVLYADGFDEALRIDLTDGDVALVDRDAAPWGSGSSLDSPDGAWQVVLDEVGPPTLRSADGTVVVPRAPGPTWTLDRWDRPDRVVGAVALPSGEALMSCVVPSGECTAYAESTGLDVSLPED